MPARVYPHFLIVKLLVFALIPPPHHGQSHMVQMMLEGFGGDQRKQVRSGPRPPIECYHVDARFATDMKDMGSFRPGKGLLLIRYILEALWCRVRHGADVLYYCPAMPQKATLLRDIIVLLALRPFFRRTIFFWHAAGLGEWLESGAVGHLLAKLGHRALDRADLALTPAAYNLADLRKFDPKVSMTVPYGIPDPCPDFERTVLGLRRQRLAERQGPARPVIKLLYMALCTEEKGLLDAIGALKLLRDKKGEYDSPYSFELTVAGTFLNPNEERKFWSAVKENGLEDGVHYAGFISGEEKNRLLATSDIFCFPTYFCGESFGIVIIEAMAFGLPIVTTRWRTIPEFFAADYTGLVDIKRPDQVAAAILKVLKIDPVSKFREDFRQRFTIEQHLRNLSNAFLTMAKTTRAALQPVPGNSPAVTSRP